MRLLLSIYIAFVLSMFCFGVSKAQQSSTFAQQITIKEVESPPVEVVAVDNRIIVSNAPVGSKLEIYSVVGIKVAEIEMKEPSGEYPVNIAKGYYIVRISNTVRKVAIR